MIKRTDIEIMAPVGCYESLHAAINAGANSIYFGIGRLNMRSASAANFSEKFAAEAERILSRPMPKYTEFAPAFIAA